MSRTARSILYGLTLGVLLALLLAPQSGWLVRFQALSLLRFAPVPGYGLGDSATSQRRLEAVALSHPGDYQLQYASLPWGDPKRVGGLRRLETRFPDNASLRANVLRQATAEASIFARSDEDYLLEQKAAPATNLPHVSNPAMLNAFDRDAAEGERLDPDNSYFPFMRAVGLYAEHKDAQARAALLRAGAETQWREYWDDEVAGQSRLQALAFGDHSAIYHVMVTAAVLFPHYSLLRNVDRIATYQAMRDEQTGNIKEGTALRHALIHCGGLMRAQSQSLIGSLVGMAIVQTAMQRPGGSPWVEGTKANNVSREASYVAYLRRHGMESAAQYAIAEGRADQQARVVTHSFDNIFGIVYDKSLSYLIWCWVVSLILLSEIPWLLLLRALTAAVGRNPAVRETRPLPGWTSWGIVAGTLAAIGILFFSALNLTGDWVTLPSAFTTGLFLMAIIIPVLLLWRAPGRPFQRRSIGRALGIAILTYAGWYGIYALAQWQLTGPLDYFGILGYLAGNDDSGGALFGTPTVHFFAPLVPLAVPLLLVVTLAVVSRVHRVPVSNGLVAGCRAVCLPLACVLLLAYGAVTLVTLHQERLVNDALTQSLRGEGAYVAARTGQVWPGVVPER